jgi:hypothetical protein
MIVKDVTKFQRRRIGIRLVIGLVLACLLLLLVMRMPFNKSSAPVYQQDVIFCSAEQVEEGKFISNGLLFGSAKTQSDQFAHSGQFSCRLPINEGAVYGFGYTYENPPAGQSFKVSVWRKQHANSGGLLAVSIEGDYQKYIQEQQAFVKDSSGWEKLEIRFSIPFQQKVEQFKVYVYSQGYTEVFFDDLLIENLPSSSSDYFQPTTIELVLDEKAYEKLRNKRDEALKVGILESGDDDWVAATLKEGEGQIQDVKIRLKGDWLDHLRGEKWSFRVKMKGEATWNRMRSFSLQTPLSRYFLSEWVLHHLWEREGVLTTRYDFIELKLNGNSLGIYAYEEHFEKQLVEYRERREGPILKLSEAPYWEAIKRQLANHGFIVPVEGTPTSDWKKAEVQAFAAKQYEENPTLAKLYEQAQYLLYQYQAGLLPADQVFDLEKMAKFYAICDVANAYHGIVWHNQRFYYNPISALLEPVGFDGYGGPPEKQYTLLGNGSLHPARANGGAYFSTLFMDTTFVTSYISALNKISQKKYLQPVLDSIFPAWSSRLVFLQREFQNYKPELNDLLIEAQYLNAILLPINGFSVAANLKEDSEANPILELENRHHLPVKVVGYGHRVDELSLALDHPFILPGAIERKYLSRLRKDTLIKDFKKVRFLEEGAIQLQSPPIYFEMTPPTNGAKYIFYSVLGIDSLFSTPIRSIAANEPVRKALELRHQAALSNKGIYSVEGQRILFSKGVHEIMEDIVLPRGYTVVLEPGTTLAMKKGTHFISYSPVQAYGTSEEPIVITSSEGYANGFSVLEAEGKSVLKNVVFRDLSSLNAGNWSLTGAVTFYKSDVEIYRSAFLGNQSEDALNIINSTFQLDQCLIQNTQSDGLDADFCKGTIKNSQFMNTTNDGIDCSGSIINIEDCILQKNGDKGISVGEQSDVTVFNTSIEEAVIGVASKDLSVLFTKDIKLVSCEQGFVAYQKKPEFGGAKIVVESYEVENVKRLYAIAPGSTLQIDGQLVE